MQLNRERRTNLTRKTTPARKPAKKPAAKKALSVKKPAPKKKTHAPKKPPAPKRAPVAETTLLSRILKSLEDDKAEQIVDIDMQNRSSLCDAIVVASGRSSRHVTAIAEHLARRLKEAGYGTRPVDGVAQGDWVLVDAGDVIVHIFRPEVRSYYDLEGMWAVDERPVRARRKTR